MEYGLLLLGEHDPESVVRLGQLAEQAGFRDLWFADEKFFRDPFVSLTHLAHHTSRIRLGTCVTDPFTRHPALLAMAMGTLDEVSGGRAVLGLGAGFSGLEAMGVERKRAVRSMRQAIDVIRRLWAGESVTLQDDAFHLSNLSLNFPARSDIPILLASAGPLMLRLAGETADEVMFGDLGTAEVLTPALAEVRRGAERSGRSMDSMRRIARLNVVLSDDLEAARDVIRPWILAYLWHAYPDWSKLFDYTPEWDERMHPLREFIAARGDKPRNVGDREQVLQFAPLLPEPLVRRYALLGPPEGVAEQIAEVAACGITQLTVYPTPLTGQSTEAAFLQFIRSVLPLL
jgi:5,10-methylenetetrahydromethanopterin reductase